MLTPEREAEIRACDADNECGECRGYSNRVQRDLLSEIDRLRAEVAEHELRARALRADVAECQEAADAEADEADRLRAELAALREAGEGLLPYAEQELERLADDLAGLEDLWDEYGAEWGDRLIAGADEAAACRDRIARWHAAADYYPCKWCGSSDDCYPECPGEAPPDSSRPMLAGVPMDAEPGGAYAPVERP